jgi:hypothetical protein
MEEQHMEYKNNFQLLQLLLSNHPGCLLLQPNRSFESMSENLVCLYRNSCTGLEQITVLFLRVSEYLERREATPQILCVQPHAS